IPVLGAPTVQSQMSEPNYYAFESGSPVDNAGAAVYQNTVFKSTKNVFVSINVPAGLAAIPPWINSNKDHGYPAGPLINTPAVPPDPAPYVSQILKGGTQAVYMTNSGNNDDAMIVAVRKAGSNIPIIRPINTISPSNITAMGKYATEVYVVGVFLPAADT